MSSNNSLFVLANDAVHNLLINLSRSEIMTFHNKLTSCLVEFSRGQERLYQPDAGIVNRPEGQKILFRAFTSPSAMGTKIVVNPQPQAQKPPPLSGIITLCDPNGAPSGIVNAKEVTGYRTAMSAMIPFLWRRNPSHIVVFGAGLQALWHIRLAMALRGSEIKGITVVNRSLPRARDLVAQVTEENAARWQSQAELCCLDPSVVNYDAQLRSVLEKATIIFCTVGSMSPVLLSSHLPYISQLGETSNTLGPLITGVGSWQADMVEVDPQLVREAVRCSSHIDLSSFASNSSPGAGQRSKRGAVLVDDADAARTHAGEIVQAGIAPEEILEIGDIVHGLRQGTLSTEVQEWMASGFLVYKSIGVSMTDVVAGEAIVEMAKNKQLGTLISRF